MLFYAFFDFAANCRLLPLTPPAALSSFFCYPCACSFFYLIIDVKEIQSKAVAEGSELRSQNHPLPDCFPEGFVCFVFSLCFRIILRYVGKKILLLVVALLCVLYTLLCHFRGKIVLFFIFLFLVRLLAMWVFSV